MKMFTWNIVNAVTFCFGNASLYVGAMYLIPKRVRSQPRDSIVHMQYRMGATSLATVVSMLLFSAIVPTNSSNAWVAMGLVAQNTLQMLISTAFLMAIFYLGPLATFIHFVCISVSNNISVSGIVTPRESTSASTLGILTDILCSGANELLQGPVVNRWIVIRNIIVAPITEELVFRSVLVPALYLALVSGAHSAESSEHTAFTPWAMVWLNPLWFGLAHMHHLVEKINLGWSVGRAVTTSLVQLTYTSIFGAIATLLLLRTGCIYPAILSHCICNSVGLPDVSFMQPPGGSQSDAYSALYACRYLHLFLHAAGLVLFAVAILPLTEVYAEQSAYWK